MRDGFQECFYGYWNKGGEGADERMSIGGS